MTKDGCSICWQRWLEDSCEHLKPAEPKEGASSAMPLPKAATVADGVPSCDSPELAAIRAARKRIGDAVQEMFHKNDYGVWLVEADKWRSNSPQYVDTLLRMVEELTQERDGWHDSVSGVGGWMDMVTVLRKERNELRAKLAESEREAAGNLAASKTIAACLDAAEKRAEASEQRATKAEQACAVWYERSRQ